MRERRMIAALVTLAALSAGCERPWQHGRTVVVAMAEGVASADAALDDAYEAMGCETDDVARLRQCVAMLEDQAEVLRIVRASVLEGETLVDAWRQAGTEPEDWRAWLDTAGQLAARLVALLESSGVEVPADVSRIAEAVDNWLEGRR